MKKFARAETGGGVHFGLVEGDSLELLEGSPFGEYRPTGQRVALAEVRLLAPCAPSKILAIGLNYASHLDNRPAPEKPEPFLVPRSALGGPGDDIVLPPGASHVEEEAELVAVIGRRCKNILPEKALECLLGYTCGNDVSERLWQKSDKHWWRAKGSDTFSPIGPYIVQGLHPESLVISGRVNGREVQRGRTADMLFKLPALISFITRHMTLEPGDLIFTGTPGKPERINAGDVVEVEIEGIGLLRNNVI